MNYLTTVRKNKTKVLKFYNKNEMSIMFILSFVFLLAGIYCSSLYSKDKQIDNTLTYSVNESSVNKYIEKVSLYNNEDSILNKTIEEPILVKEQKHNEIVVVKTVKQIKPKDTDFHKTVYKVKDRFKIHIVSIKKHNPTIAKATLHKFNKVLTLTKVTKHKTIGKIKQYDKLTYPEYSGNIITDYASYKSVAGILVYNL